MSKVHAVLLVPEKGDPHGLLKEGPCGARPPTAWLDHDGKGNSWWRAGCKAAGIEEHDALVLAWDGKPVAEGLDRATAAATTTPQWWVDYPALSDRSWPRHEIAKWVGPALADLCSCTLVLLDAEGREVAP